MSKRKLQSEIARIFELIKEGDLEGLTTGEFDTILTPNLYREDGRYRAIEVAAYHGRIAIVAHLINLGGVRDGSFLQSAIIGGERSSNQLFNAAFSRGYIDYTNSNRVSTLRLAAEANNIPVTMNIIHFFDRVDLTNRTNRAQQVVSDALAHSINRLAFDTAALLYYYTNSADRPTELESNFGEIIGFLDNVELNSFNALEVEFERGNDLLNIALIRGRADIARIVFEINVSNLSSQNIDGNTVWHLLAMLNDADFVEGFIFHNNVDESGIEAAMRVENANGLTPLMIAQNNNNADLVTLFRGAVEEEELILVPYEENGVFNFYHIIEEDSDNGGEDFNITHLHMHNNLRLPIFDVQDVPYIAGVDRDGSPF